MEEKLQIQINQLNDLLRDIHLNLFSSSLSIDDFEGLYEALKQADELNQEINDNINSNNIDFKDAPSIAEIILKIIIIVSNIVIGGLPLIILSFFWLYTLGKDFKKLKEIIQNGMEDLAKAHESVEKNIQIIQNRKEILYKKMTKLLETRENEQQNINEVTAKLLLANKFINSYINEEKAFMIDEETKNMAVSILQYDLESDSNSLTELLIMAKKKNQQNTLIRKKDN